VAVAAESTYTLQLQLAPPDTAPTKPPARNGAALAGASAKKRGCGRGNVQRDGEVHRRRDVGLPASSAGGEFRVEHGVAAGGSGRVAV